MDDPPYPQLCICRSNKLQIPDVFSEKCSACKGTQAVQPFAFQESTAILLKNGSSYL